LFFSGEDAYDPSTIANKSLTPVWARPTWLSPLFLQIVTPAGLHCGWPVHKGTTGYAVAEEIAKLSEPGEVTTLAERRKEKGG
jgi:hypothetical protein